MRWITDKIIALIQDIPEIDKVSKGACPGGDFDTRPIILEVDDEYLLLSGFNTQDTIGDKDWDDASIEFIEVKDGKDSRGGCFSANQKVIIAYAKVCAALRVAGFQTADTYEWYF